VPERTPDPRSDQDLVHAANRGDAAALETLYLRYREWALALAYRFTGDRDAAHDAAHEAWVYVLGKFPGFRLTARFTTFLYPAIRNSALAARRKLRPAAADEELLALVPYDAAPGGEETERAALARAVDALPAGQREVLLMRVVDGMAVAEIALALGIPEGTVKSRLHHAIAALKANPTLASFFDPDAGNG